MSRDLNDTIIFAKVIERGSFTAGARALGLPKATVSRKVRDLEQRLGSRLINRTTRRLALTEAGSVYYEHSRRLAEELEAAEEAVYQLEGRPRGWLRVTAPYAFGVAVLAPMVLDFRARYPDVHVDMVLDNEVRDLVADGIDVAIRFGPLADSSMVARRLGTHPSRVYASEHYLSQHGEPRSPAELAQHRAVVHSKQRRGRRFAWSLRRDGEDAAEDYEVHPVFIANDPWPILDMLAAGEGLMLSTRPVVMCCEQADNVRAILPGWSGPDVPMHAVLAGGRALSPKIRAFVDFLVDRLQTIDQPGGATTTPAATAGPEIA